MCVCVCVWNAGIWLHTHKDTMSIDIDKIMIRKGMKWKKNEMEENGFLVCDTSMRKRRRKNRPKCLLNHVCGLDFIRSTMYGYFISI